MKRTFIAGAAAALGFMATLTLTPAAHAQGTLVQPVQHPLAVKVGVFVPTGTHGASAIGTNFSAGADYAFTKTAAANPVLPSAYFDYFGGSRNGGHAYVFAIGPAVRTYLGKPGTNGSSPYVGAGIGLYDVSAKRRDENSRSNVTFGGKVFVGDDLSSNFFVEANYQFVPSVASVNPSGFNFQVGYRF